MSTAAVAFARYRSGRVLLPEKSGRGRCELAEQSFSGLHRVLEHKYYVDEIYDAAVVQP